MFSELILLTLLSSSAFAVPADIAKRQATDGAQYSAAGSAIIASYIPASAFAIIEANAQHQASIAAVSYTDPKQLVYDGFLAATRPWWFVQAIPTEYLPEINAMEGSIDALRGTVEAAPAPTAGGALGVSTAVVVTTTDFLGSTVTYTSGNGVASTTTTGVAGVLPIVITTTDFLGSTVTFTTSQTITTPTIATSAIGSSYSSFVSTFTDSAGSTITSVGSSLVSGASSVGSSIVSGPSSVGSSVVSGASSVGSSLVNGASSVGSGVVSTVTSGGAGVLSTITSGVVSVLSTITSGVPASTSSAAGAERTAVAGAGAVAMGFVGLMAVL